MCWDQNVTSILKPIQCTAISIPLVTGSFFPTRSNTMLIVDYINIVQLCITQKIT